MNAGSKEAQGRPCIISQFSAKNGQIIGSCPPLGNTGSATSIFAEIRIIWKWIFFQFLGLVGSSEILFAIAIGLVGDTTFAIKKPWE